LKYEVQPSADKKSVGTSPRRSGKWEDNKPESLSATSRTPLSLSLLLTSLRFSSDRVRRNENSRNVTRSPAWKRVLVTIVVVRSRKQHAFYDETESETGSDPRLYVLSHFWKMGYGAAEKWQLRRTETLPQ